MQLVTHQTGPEGQKVRRLYIEDGADIKKNTTCRRDRPRHAAVAFIASSEGGMDIEEVAHSHPEKIITESSSTRHRPDRPRRPPSWPAIGMPADSTWPGRGRAARSSTSATWTPTPRWWKSTR
jgi:succinyl-CoA synthetase beta subunit